MKKVKEVRGLKCPNHDYVRDNHHFMYEETYPRGKTSIRHKMYQMWLHNVVA
ncbi:hypothetical protein NXV73_23575 [Bacteroides salyersiae]|nr:hypothetical protein [Bacteroides salyersiae]